MAGLEVQIGGDITDLQKKIKEAEFNIKELSKLKLEKIKLGLDTKEINSNIASVKKSLNELKTVSKDTGNSFSGMTPKVANGGNALMQFSRIAQDAPFGIIGIGNNITATVEAFGHLKQSTGSTGGALKSLASSLVGSGGILLAVSLVTSALTYMSQNNMSVGDVLSKLSGDFDNLKKAITDVNNESAKNAGAEIANLNALVSISKDENNTREQRLAAVQKLQKEYPAYFGNLTKEQILNGNVEGAVKAVVFALIQKAKAQILATKIGENDLKILELQQKGQKELGDYVAGKGLFAVLKGALGMQVMKVSVDSTAKSIDALKKEQKLYTTELEKSTKAANTFEVANENAGRKREKTFVTPKVSGIESNIQSAGLAETGGKVLQIAKNIQGAEGMITTSMGNIKMNVDISLLGVLEAMKAFNDSANELITGSIGDTFSNLGTAIGQAMATGGNVFQAIGSSILASIGSFLSEMGGLLIKYGTLAVLKGKLDLAILTGGPVSIAAGFAAIAVGIALKAAGGAIGSASSGGGKQSGAGSVSTGASVSSPSSSTGSSSGGSSFQGGTVVFEISGQSLIGVLGNTLDKNRRLGGSLGLG